MDFFEKEEEDGGGGDEDQCELQQGLKASHNEYEKEQARRDDLLLQ